MIQIFYKDKPIIISDKKSDLNKSLLIDSKLISSVNILKILNKTKVSSIGIISKNPDKIISKFSKLFPEIIAAGGKVYNDKSEILFIFRNKKWDLPKGKAEKNENISQTAIREVIEETGIENLSISSPLNKTYHIFNRGKKHYLKTTYWFEMKSNFKGKFKPQLKEGISRVEWISADNLDKVLLKSYANIRLLIN
tara:strand:+ start:519 stop:1103 length:585 start_codon:yes stop_codon:yes gene_type:complete